ncbi:MULTISPECIES: hypothetical protein [unclassified Sphingopyxis]|uniref:hypothetical protein n=1 Tax=unclassified Sphingopyxis TaxID=2614943 RepID=UPI0028586E18|nr:MULTISPECIES: hypothetical protein [unclassified Sphingopyxis]MDR6834571.1 hypothetical protein [Sphingopyxis sp. BE122]MDR7226841.1 hypothetical protein [Sphingopyxis sp. BE259]
MIAALLFAAALAADPVPAPVAAPASAAAPIAEADLREFVAIAGRKVAGRPVGGPIASADKVLLIARDDKGFPVIAVSTGFPARQALPAPPQNMLAVVRLRQRYETPVPGPSANDLAFVAAHRLPLFVIGEWARPAPMWEVAWVDDAVRFRTIGEVGEIGPWQD